MIKCKCICHTSHWKYSQGFGGGCIDCREYHNNKKEVE